MVKVGVIGAGTIGSRLIEEILKDREFKLVGVYDREESKVLGIRGIDLKKPEELIEESDVIVESASVEAVKTYVKLAVESGRNVLVMSVGALIEDQEIISKAREKKCKIFIPSGAIAGLDGIRASCLAGIDSITLTTTKNPEAFLDLDYIKKKQLKLKDLKEPVVIFEGIAEEAVKYFPANINIAASICLSLGPFYNKNIFKIKIIADPALKNNIHSLNITSQVGKISIVCENIPDEKNKKTSKLAIYSAISTLRRLKQPILEFG